MRGLPGLFTALVARHIVRHKLRALLTLSSVAIGVAVYVAIDIADRTSIDSFESSAQFVSGNAALEADAVGAGFPDETVARVGAIPGVAAASPVVAGLVTDPSTADAYDLAGVDFLAATRAGGTGGPAFPAGKAQFSRAIFERGAIVVSRSLARTLQVHLGDELPMVAGVRTVAFTVAGIVDDSAVPIGARGVIFCDLSTAQEALGRIGRIDRIDIVPSAGADIGRIELAAARILPPGTQFTTPQQRGATLAKLTDAFRYSLGSLAAIALLVGGFFVFNAVSMSVVQRRSEIGVVRALGATRAAVFIVFLLEGALVGALGSAAGIVAGRALATAALHQTARTFAIVYGATHPFGISAPPATYAIAVVVGVTLAMAASLLPALEASGVAPSTAMRAGSWERPPSAPTTNFALGAVIAFAAAYGFAELPAIDGRPFFGYAAALLVLAGCSLLAPPLVALVASLARMMLPAQSGVSMHLAPANLRARVRRNAVAVASLMIGVSMTVSVSTTIDSLRDAVQDWIVTTFRGDLFVRPYGAVTSDAVTMPAAVASRLTGLPGIAALDLVRSSQIVADGRDTFAASSDMRVTGVHGYLPLLDGGDWPSVARGLIGTDDALVSETLARKIGVHRGDRVVVGARGGSAALRVDGVFEDFSNDAGYVFVDSGTYVRLFGDAGIKGIAVYASKGFDVDKLRGEIGRALDGARIDVRTNAQLRELATAQFNRTFAVTTVLDAIAIAVALMGILATLAALVLERRREIGLLRCLGMTRSEVRAMIVFEALLLGVMGAALGVAAGYALAAIRVYVITPQAFGWTIAMHGDPGYVIALCAGVALTAACAGLIPAAAAASLDVAKALRTE